MGRTDIRLFDETAGGKRTAALGNNPAHLRPAGTLETKPKMVFFIGSSLQNLVEYCNTLEKNGSFGAQGSIEGWQISVVTQPDLNILDLGFFHTVAAIKQLFNLLPKLI
eukprot:gene33998-41141_t